MDVDRLFPPFTAGLAQLVLRWRAGIVPAPRSGSLRAGRWLLPALALAGSWACDAAGAESAVADRKEDAKPKITFSPDVEAKLAELVKKVAEAKRKMWGLRMKKEIDEVAKVAGLGGEGMKALEAPAEQAVELCIGGWSARMEELFRGWHGDQASENFEQMLAQAEAYARNDYVSDYVRPNDHAAWAEALRRVLTAEQASAWDTVQAERQRVLGKEIGEFLKREMERTREQYSRAIRPKSAEIQLALALPKERAEKLEALAKTAVDRTMEEWGIRAEKFLLSMEDEQRRKVMRPGQFYVAPEETNLPHKQAVWKEGLANLLSSDELKRLETFREERKSRRARVMGQIMLAELDSQIAFTANQRRRLQPIAERLVKDQPLLFPKSEHHGDFAIQTFFTAGSKASEEEMNAILDPIQWKHWQEVCQPKPSSAAGKAKPEADGKPPPSRKPEPEDVEHGISDFLHEKTAKERKRVLAAMILRAEDAARVAGLSAVAISRLQTAARGVTEETLAAWKSTKDQSVRARLRDATPENVKQRLASIQDYTSSSREGRRGPEKHALWDKTVKAELTERQRAAWQKEVDERAAFREKAIVSAVMGEFDRLNLLTTEQWEKLEPIIAALVKDYSHEFANYFSSSMSAPWYLQSYYMLIPFGGVPEQDLKAILTKEQWDRWTGSDEFANKANYWESIKRNREQRVKAEQANK